MFVSHWWCWSCGQVKAHAGSVELSYVFEEVGFILLTRYRMVLWVFQHLELIFEFRNFNCMCMRTGMSQVLEFELQTDVNCCVSAWNWTWVLMKAASALNLWAILSFALLEFERNPRTCEACAVPPSHIPVLFSENRMLALGTGVAMKANVARAGDYRLIFPDSWLHPMTCLNHDLLNPMTLCYLCFLVESCGFSLLRHMTGSRVYPVLSTVWPMAPPGPGQV